MFWHIHKQHLFTLFALKYSQKFKYKYLIISWCDAKQNMLKRIFASEQIFASLFSNWQIFTSKYLFWSEYSQNLAKFPLKGIFACKFLHTSKYSRCIASIFTSLRHQLIFGSFWKYSLHFASNFSLWSEIKKLFAEKRIFTSVFIHFACKSAYLLHIHLYSLRTKYSGAP